MKKVLGLVISERYLGNSEILVKEVMNNIPEEVEKELIRLTDFDLNPCKACYQCLKPGAECIRDDDFNFIINKIKESDALIIGMPVYFLGPPAYFKLFADRLLGIKNHLPDTKNKPSIIITPFGITGWEGYSKTVAISLPRVMQMNIVDVWQVPAALPGESVLSKENLTYAKDLGSRLFLNEEYKKGERECSQCGSDLFRLLPNGEVECPICGGIGELHKENIPDFSKSKHNRFSDEELENHFGRWLVEVKQKFMTEKDRLKEVQKPYKEMNWWIKKKG